MEKMLCALTVLMIVVWMTLQSQIIQKGFSIIKVFNLSWMSMMVVYLLNPYDFYELNKNVFYYSMLFCSVVNITFLAGCKKIVATNIDYAVYDSSMIESKRQITFIIILSFACWAMSSFRLYNSIMFILQNGMAALRYEVYFGDIYTTIERLAYQYFVQPLFVISIILAVQQQIMNRPGRNKWLVVVALINAFVYSLLFGGRSLIMSILIYSLIMMFINSGGSIGKVLARQRKIVISLSIFALIVAAYSTMRISRSWGVIAEFGIYSTGGLGVLSQMLDGDVLEYGILGGKGIIGGVYDLVAFVFKIFGKNIELVSQTYSNYTANYYFIGDGIKTNFTATAIATFLLDGGIIGIIAGGVVYGLLFLMAEKRFNKSSDLFGVSIYLYVANTAYESIQNYTYKSIVCIFVILYLWMLFDKGRIGKFRISLNGCK